MFVSYPSHSSSNHGHYESQLLDPYFRQWNDEEINYLCNSGPVSMFNFSEVSVKKNSMVIS